MNFLPSDYEAPKSNSPYMKLEDGENRFRVLSLPILGWEDWEDKQPKRFRLHSKPEKSIDPLKPFKHFWAFIVWNYPANRIQILEITQASIRKRLEALSKDQDWGSPFAYDIKITKSGQAKDTEYVVNPCPQRPVDPSVKDAFSATPIDLEELFRGGEPFVAKGAYRTKAFWEMEEDPAPIVSDEPLVTKEQAQEIEDQITTHIDPTAPNWKVAGLTAFKIKSFSQLKAKHYQLMMDRIHQKKEELKMEDDCPF